MQPSSGSTFHQLKMSNVFIIRKQNAHKSNKPVPNYKVIVQGQWLMAECMDHEFEMHV